MKTVILTTIIFLAGTNLANAQVGQSSDKKYSHKISIRVDGIACPFCSRALEKKLLAIESVDSFEADIEEAKVILKIKVGEYITEKELEKAISDSGFTLVSIVQLNNRD